jgi:hypothetical protein
MKRCFCALHIIHSSIHPSIHHASAGQVVTAGSFWGLSPKVMANMITSLLLQTLLIVGGQTNGMLLLTERKEH